MTGDQCGASVASPNNQEGVLCSGCLLADATSGVCSLSRARAQDQPGGEAPKPRGGEAAARPLTQRQLEVLAQVARGRTNRQIGEILGISEKTVRNHLRTISHKLSTSDRTHAVVLAIGNGWIPIPIEPDGEPGPVAEAAPEVVTATEPRIS